MQFVWSLGEDHGGRHKGENIAARFRKDDAPLKEAFTMNEFREK